MDSVIPGCVGTFQPGDKQCDGDPRGKTPVDRAPCAWRSRCAGLQIHCLEMQSKPADIVDQLNVPGFVALCDRYVNERNIVDGRVTINDEGVTPIVAPTIKRTRLRKSKPKHIPPIKPDMMELHTHFVEQLRSHFRGRRFSMARKLLLYAGTFYPIDRRRRSRYIAWMCTASVGRDQAIAMICFHPRFGMVDIALPVFPEALHSLLGARAAKKLHATPWHNGQFKTLCPKLDREGIALCAETIRKLVDTGALVLPEAQR